MPLRELMGPIKVSERVGWLGDAIRQDYSGRSPAFVSVLKGSFMFASDLFRRVGMHDSTMDFLGTSSYGDGTESSGAVRITHDLAHSITGRHVILIEDIVDTGLTISFLLGTLKARGPASISVCALLHKPARQRVPVKIDYLGFTIEDVFVVGYGLDHAEKYRSLDSGSP